jgi:hypothetical protein
MELSSQWLAETRKHKRIGGLKAPKVKSIEYGVVSVLLIQTWCPTKLFCRSPSLFTYAAYDNPLFVVERTYTADDHND